MHATAIATYTPCFNHRSAEIEAGGKISTNDDTFIDPERWKFRGFQKYTQESDSHS